VVVGALTFEQEIWKAIISALATALLVALGGGLVATLVSKSWENKREAFELRTKLLEQASRTAQTMYVTCQHTRRVLRDNSGNTADEVKRREQILTALDDSYRQFSADATALETVLGARYGIVSSPREENQDQAETERGEQRATTTTTGDDNKSEAFWRWHQIWDLLTVYYFNLKGRFPGKPNVLIVNSKGYRCKYHTGLDLESFVEDANAPKKEELRVMRGAIRKTYIDTLPKLANSIVKDELRTG
jgi:hypothetical protein